MGDKVLASRPRDGWPAVSRNVWCCMLANPQNLDITSLISNPSTSPFAVALQQSRYMLVVPNVNVSIYTRLWCVYEAFLAHELDLVIITASAPRPFHFWCGPVADIFVSVLVGASLGVGGAASVAWLNFPNPRLWVTWSFGFALVMSFLCRGGALRWINCFGAAFLAYMLGNAVFGRLRGEACVERWSHSIIQLEAAWCAHFEMLLYIISAVDFAYFGINEADRLRSTRAKQSATQLCESPDATWGLLDGATCSVATDKKAILDEIGN